MELVYRSLVRDTLLPSDPGAVGNAALAAMAGPGVTLPTWFGVDVERDGAWLAAQLPGDGPWWHVFRSMVHACDKPHTGLMDAAGGAAMRALMSGQPAANPGFALWLQPDGRLAVSDVDDRGSAQASGLRPGDLVETVAGLPPRPSGLDILQFHAAPAGRRFAVQVDRFGERLAVDLVLRSGEVPVVTRRMLRGAVGYLNLRWFARTNDEAGDTAAAVRARLGAFTAEGARGVVIDLRAGVGGDLRAVIGILSAMCDATTVAAIMNTDGEPVEYSRDGERIWPDLPVAVLINEQSTSAAEHLAIGLAEWLGAALVGTPTSGGLNTLSFVDLADGYRLALPATPGLGPHSLAVRPGHRLEPTVAVPNPSASDIASGVDAQLETARRWITAASAR